MAVKKAHWVWPAAHALHVAGVVAALQPELQKLLQEPQFFASVRSEHEAPAGNTLVQTDGFEAGHVQAPAAQDAPVVVSQAKPHVPQFVLSSLRSTHVPPQFV